MDLARKMAEGEMGPVSDLLTGDLDRVPVTPEEFFTDDYYFGKSLKELHPEWMSELCHVLDPQAGVTEWILSGAIGTGKTTVATAAMGYKLYWLSCFTDPAAFYGLLPGSRIVFTIFNITLDKADCGYDKLKFWMDESVYFNKDVPRYKKKDDPITFPSKNIEVHVGSLSTHALGDDMFGFMMDEANFFKRIRGRSVSDADRSRAHDIYDEASRRQVSRFLRHGTVPGLNCLISSQRTESEFLEQRKEAARTDPRRHATSFAIWEVPRPGTNLCGETFEVMVGNNVRQSRVLDEGECCPDGFKNIEVPVEYREFFLEDCAGALRDFGGVSVSDAGRFFALVDRVHLCVDNQRSHPFTVEVVEDLSFKDPEAGLLKYLKVDELFHTRRSRLSIKLNPHSPRFAHVDIGLRGDALGLAIGHVTDAGRLYYDLLLRVSPPLDGEVDLDAVVEFFKGLRRMGMPIRRVTYDQYQSKQSIQQLIKAGFDSARVSTNLDAYQALRRKIYSGPSFLSYYPYVPLLEELNKLQKGEPGEDPDHPTGGSKDVADAAAGVAIAVTETGKLKSDYNSDRLSTVMSMLPRKGGLR